MPVRQGRSLNFSLKGLGIEISDHYAFSALFVLQLQSFVQYGYWTITGEFSLLSVLDDLTEK